MSNRIPTEIFDLIEQYKGVARALDVLVDLFDSPVYQGPDIENRDIAELLSVVQEKLDRLNQQADSLLNG